MMELWVRKLLSFQSNNGIFCHLARCHGGKIMAVRYGIATIDFVDSILEGDTLQKLSAWYDFLYKTVGDYFTFRYGHIGRHRKCRLFVPHSFSCRRLHVYVGVSLRLSYSTGATNVYYSGRMYDWATCPYRLKVHSNTRLRRYQHQLFCWRGALCSIRHTLWVHLGCRPRKVVCHLHRCCCLVCWSGCSACGHLEFCVCFTNGTRRTHSIDKCISNFDFIDGYHALW